MTFAAPSNNGIYPHHPPDRRRPVRADQRLAKPASLHDGRGLSPDRRSTDRPTSKHTHTGRLTDVFEWRSQNLHHLDGRGLEERIRELERQLGRKTLEVEILKEALNKSRSKKLTRRSRPSGVFR
ncbi:MAG: hypothetical protein ACJAVR_000846 [Paracoccaceae bacterium]